ncbi:hypothetical protein [Mesorhizobium sp. M0040]|uniref:hypothetical protein n=1 Tax=Mesorhizobium sp. M0040 TaxID=2956855 RepID=UPI00333D7239
MSRFTKFRSLAFVLPTVTLGLVGHAFSFTPLTSYIDLNSFERRQSNEYSREYDDVNIDCDELDRRAKLDAEYSNQRQHLLQQRTEAIKQNDASLIEDLNGQLSVVQRRQAVNLMVIKTLKALPVHMGRTLAPTSDRIRFLLSRAGEGDPYARWDEFKPRWPSGSVAYLRFKSSFPTRVEWSGRGQPQYGVSGNELLSRKANFAKLDAPAPPFDKYESLDPFNYTSATFGVVTAFVFAPVVLEPDVAPVNCDAIDCRYSFDFGSVTLDLAQGQICDAYESSDGTVFETVVDYNFGVEQYRVETLAGFDISKKRPMTDLDTEALNSAIDSLLKPFIEDVIGPTHLYDVSDDPLKIVSRSNASAYGLSELRAKLDSLYSFLTSALGRPPTLAEVDSYFDVSNPDRYRDAGYGKIEFVYPAGGGTIGMTFSRDPDGILLLSVRPDP